MMIYVLILGVAMLLISSSLKRKRLRLNSELSSLYDKIELSLIGSNIHHLKNEQVEYLKNYKFIKVNPEVADLEILIKINVFRGRPDKQRINRIKMVGKSFPEETRQYFGEFDKIVYNLIQLSRFKPRFIVLTSYAIMYSIISRTSKSLKELVRLKQGFHVNDYYSNELGYCLS